MDAVGRRAADIVKAVFRLSELQRPVESQRIADPAAVTLRCHNAHIGKLGRHSGQNGNPLGKIAVVVANQDVHYCSPFLNLLFDADMKAA